MDTGNYIFSRVPRVAGLEDRGCSYPSRGKSFHVQYVLSMCMWLCVVVSAREAKAHIDDSSCR